MDKANLGPAEQIISVMLTHADHIWHGRSGIVTSAPELPGGVRWEFGVVHKRCPFHQDKKTILRCPDHPNAEQNINKSKKTRICSECHRNLRQVGARVCSSCGQNVGRDGVRVAFRLTKSGKRNLETRIGTVRDDRKIEERGQVVAEYRAPGLFPEVATWTYQKIADIWKLDNEFAAHWASYAFSQEHRDLKMMLAAFMLVQNRCGEPVREGGKVAFLDEDYRDVGEAMVLIPASKPKNKTEKKSDAEIRPKFLLRMHDVLRLPQIAALNRELGFGKSARHPFLGRWDKAVGKWLRFREDNPKMLEGLVKGGMRQTVIELVRRVGYKPASDKFFEVLRWRQLQAKDGRRTLAIGKAVAGAETWDGMSETQICERIEKSRPDYKRIVGMLPKTIGVTRAILAVAIDSGCLSDRDLIVATPTLEELGLLDVPIYKDKWAAATKTATDMRAANIATRVKTQEAKATLQEAADTALKKAAAEAMRNMRIYVVIDISGSMNQCIEVAKEHLTKFLQAFPPDRLHVSVFNTVGKEIVIKHSSAAGVGNAFRGIQATGGTHYAAGVLALDKYKPKDDEDALMIFVGDEQQTSTVESAVQISGLRPTAFGFIRVVGSDGTRYRAVQDTATRLGIPCFLIQENTFDDVYAIPRTIRNLITATPVGKTAAEAPRREGLVDLIVKCPLLQKPAWA